MIRINGTGYQTMLLCAAASLEAQKNAINKLNVFPVPDGDTGSNMCSTITAITAHCPAPDSSIGSYAASAALEMMRAARGNSGVILSLFFRGVARALHQQEEADSKDIVRAFAAGAAEACKAVMHPVRGTILTVMEDCCTFSDQKIPDDLPTLFDLLCEQAEASLRRTQDLLPALRRARVVDSGGAGFVAVLNGMRYGLKNPDARAELASIKKASDDIEMQKEEADFSAFSEDEIRFSYCTECLLTPEKELSETEENDLKAYLEERGDSIVLTVDPQLLKLHIHTNDSLEVLAHMRNYGPFTFCKIENMKQQHSNLTSARTSEPSEEDDHQEDHARCGVLAVSGGEGFSDLFCELGAMRTVPGGQSMNPSVNEIMKAIRKMPCQEIILLPNNPNIVATAKQVGILCEDKKISVVESKTMPQGISAMLSFDSEKSAKENAVAMSEALKWVKTMSVTKAVKNAELDGLNVRKDQYIGLSEKEVRYAAASERQCIALMADEMKNYEMITIYYGKGIDQQEAEEIAAMLTELLGNGCDIRVERGAQAVYPYIFALE